MVGNTQKSIALAQLNSTELLFRPSAAPILEPLGHPNRPKIAPSRLLTPYFFKNVIFHETLRFSRFPALSGSQDDPPKRPKIAPRRLQDDLEELLFSTSILSSILNTFCSQLGSKIDPNLRSKWCPRGCRRASSQFSKNIKKTIGFLMFLESRGCQDK